MSNSTMNRRVFCTACFLLTTGYGAAALAQGPEAFLKAKQDELIAILRQGDGAAADKKLESIFSKMLDYDALARLSLDKHWDERTDQEKNEFTDVLRRLVQNAYKKNIKKTLNYDVSYKGEGRASKGHLVRTVARNRQKPREEPVSVDYVLHQVGGQWRVFDVVTEGSSMVMNYRGQFNRIIKKNGFAELLKKMRNKAESGESD
jgi:phospholipid transport system substrate-binding protein